MKKINEPILLEQIRDERNRNKLLFNVLVKQNSLIIATKARGNKEETLVDMGEILEPYIGPERIEVLKEACSSIYNKKKNK